MAYYDSSISVNNHGSRLNLHVYMLMHLMLVYTFISGRVVVASFPLCNKSNLYR